MAACIAQQMSPHVLWTVDTPPQRTEGTYCMGGMADRSLFPARSVCLENTPTGISQIVKYKNMKHAAG